MKYCQIWLLLLPSLGFGQIIGKVNGSNGEALGFASVTVHLAADSSSLGGTATAEDGSFAINHPLPGTYYLSIHYLGYQTYFSAPFTLSAESPRYELSALQLSASSQALSEVLVSARKDLTQSSETGLNFNIQGSLLSKGSNALQVLERLPGVTLDRRYGQISLNGQTGVGIQIDGRRVPMSMEELVAFLENTVADNIEKIELITAPSAQYDADGGAGIINIVLKKHTETGTRGNFSTTAGYGFREKVQTSLGLSHGFQHADVRVAYSYLHDGSRSGFKGHGVSNIPVNGGVSNGKFANFSEQLQNTHSLHLTTELRPSAKTTLGTDINISFAHADNLARIDNTWDVQAVEYIRREALSDGHNKRRNLIASLYWKNKLSDKTQLNLDAGFISYGNNSPTSIQSNYFDRQDMPYDPQNENFINGNRSESRSGIQVGVLQADYTQQVGKNTVLEFGAKGSYSENTNDSRVERNLNGVWETDPRSLSNIHSTEQVLAGYAQGKFNFSKKVSGQMGLRYEYWRRDISQYDKAFVVAKLFPSLLFTYTFNERTNLRLRYNRRISRPLYVDLISNLFYNDPTAIFSGNPLLKPTLTDVVQAELDLKGVHAGLSLQQDLHPILRYQLTANATNDLLLVSPQNLDEQQSLNLFVSAPLQMLRSWKMSFSSTTSLRRYKLSYSLLPAEKTYVFQSLNVNQNIQLPGNLELELSGWYNFPFFEGSNALKGFGVLNLGLAKKLKKDWGTIQLVLPDLFRSLSVHTHISGAAPIVFGINSYSNWRSETALYRVVQLSYSRSFGKQGRSFGERQELEEEERVR